MVGKLLSLIAGVLLINSFYMPWFKFDGIKNISPLDVYNDAMSQSISFDTFIKVAPMTGIIILGILMIATLIIKKLAFSVVKLCIAIFLLIFHIGYFYTNVISKGNPLDILGLINTSPGFLVFLIAIGLYFFSVILAIIFSPFRGIMKLIGL